MATRCTSPRVGSPMRRQSGSRHSWATTPTSVTSRRSPACDSPASCSTLASRRIRSTTHRAASPFGRARPSTCAWERMRRAMPPASSTRTTKMSSSGSFAILVTSRAPAVLRARSCVAARRGRSARATISWAPYARPSARAAGHPSSRDSFRRCALRSTTSWPASRARCPICATASRRAERLPSLRITPARTGW